MPKRRIITIGATLLALSFLVFTIWIIHEANIGRDNILFQTVRATPNGDKIGHVLLAGFLTLVANFLFRHRYWQLARLRLPIGSLVVFAIAVLEESSQYFLPTRSLDIFDALANLAGILLFSIPAILWPRKARSATD
ncbi:VanZ family protein [Pelagicoccus sp. SDUM812005]|uniref:VanZ family protein n=1 Tax=Pelagicoccus sp. SDUM812005 TaxID=3041257 RepID=UPI00280F3F11|nr:VanZ family protein [Pelagicoccus sp. SDUM812005]MDQ8179719.1 VanZ family protein [Pelagicoccus sp. SDUM812005]